MTYCIYDILDTVGHGAGDSILCGSIKVVSKKLKRSNMVISPALLIPVCMSFFNASEIV